MIEHEATRTLVKSPPEIWAQCSEAEALDRHLNGSFGEIRITRLEPEHAVAWEGEEVSGTVRIEPSAWGTRVTMTVRTAQEEVQSRSVAGPEEVAGQIEVHGASVVAHDEVESGSVAAPEEVQPVLEAEPETTAPESAPSLDSSAPTDSSATFLARVRARFRRWATGAGPEAEPKISESRAVEPGVEEPEVVASEPEAPKPMPGAIEVAPASEASEAEVVPPNSAIEVAPAPEASEAPVAPPAEATEQPPSGPDSQTAGVTEALKAALESLGQAHHRPYSRA